MGKKPFWIIVSWISALLAATSCAGPQPEPLRADRLARTVEERADVSLDVLVQALELHGAPPLGLQLNGPIDPADDAYWHAHAIAFDPTVRQSRRRWLASLRDEGAAGAPGRANLTYWMQDVTEPDRQNDLRASVDLLGLLGLGPRAAEREVAARVTGLAHGRLEQSVWRAVFAVDAARVRLAAAIRRERRLNQLADEARASLNRLELLGERGRIPMALVGRVRAALAAFESQRHSLATATVRAREALAAAAGLPPHARGLGAAGESVLDAFVDLPTAVPDAAALFDAVPAIRARRLGYALAEARLRAASARWWPGLRVGTHLRLLPDQTITGGVLALDLPWPPAVAAQIEAAVERRTMAREVLEDTLVRATTAAAARHAELLIAREHRDHHAKIILAESAAAWRATTAQLSVREDVEAIDMWLDALNLRARGLLDEVNATENVLIRDLAFREAAGGRPGLEAEDER